MDNTDNILKGLNPQQQQAVLITDGPVLIIAGAGSGKTKTLTHRVAYLLSKGVSAYNILAVTFTNKAANEMKQRIGDLTGGLLKDLFIGTFHSLGARILRVEASLFEKNGQNSTAHLIKGGLRDILGFGSNFTIYDDDEQNGVIKQIMKELNINADQFNPNSIKYAISKAKNELVDPTVFEEKIGGYFEEIAAKIYRRYDQYLKANNALDFDDLIFKPVELFTKFPDVLAKYQERFRYVMVDEYQDTNHAQYVLINLLAQKYRNLFAIGDDWQSIYLFRWADVQNILNFKKDYPEAEIIPLERNYRSTQQILDAAYNVIKKNISRTDKNLWTEKKQGHLITSFEALSEKEEAMFVVEEIENLKETFNYSYKDFAVLYRTHAQSRVLEEAMLYANIPYRIVGGIKFYSRAEIKDLLAFLRLISNPADEISFRRIINVLGQGLGDKSVSKIIQYQKANNLNFLQIFTGDLDAIGLLARARLGLDNLKNIFIHLAGSFSESKITLSKFLELIINKTNYVAYLETQDQNEARLENVKELFTVTQKYDELALGQALNSFLEEVALVSDRDTMEGDQNEVNLMTLHSAKGLEFNVVFIAGLEEGILPHSRSIGNPIELEEERRLCYVGITRAKDKVYLLFTRTRKIFGSIQANMKSRFLKDIPEELIDRRESNFEDF